MKTGIVGKGSLNDEPLERRSLPDAVLRFALFGNPVGHSLSPAMHRAAYEAMGLTASYEAYRVADAGEIIPLMSK